MSRVIRVAAAQMGGTQKADPRERTLRRMVDLLEGEALDVYFERSMPNPAVQPLFDRARQLGVGFYVGYAEIADDGRRFNSSILVEPDGAVLGRYRKVHL